MLFALAIGVSANTIHELRRVPPIQITESKRQRYRLKKLQRSSSDRKAQMGEIDERKEPIDVRDLGNGGLQCLQINAGGSRGGSSAPCLPPIGEGEAAAEDVGAWGEQEEEGRGRGGRHPRRAVSLSLFLFTTRVRCGGRDG